MSDVLITVLIASGIAGLLAFFLTLASNTIGNYGEVKININKEKEMTVNGGDTLLSSLNDNKIFIPSACGGKGSCGYCKVKVNDGGGIVLPTELGYLSKEEINKNIRLSCQLKVKENIQIEIPDELLNAREYTATVEFIKDLTPRIKHLRFRLEGDDEIKFKPGQYIQIKTPKYKGNDEEVFRAYLVASSPSNKKFVELIIGYVEDGICTTYIHKHLKEGDKISFTGPFGDFYYKESDREMVMVATGTGMAPIISILEYMRENNINRKATFYFGSRYIEDLFFIERLKELERDLHDFKFVPSLSKPNEDWSGEVGRVTDAINKYLIDGENVEAYMCGSGKMIDSTVTVLKKKNLKEENIYYDPFE